MNRLTLVTFFLLIIAIAGGAAWYLIDTSKDARDMQALQTASTTPEVNENLSIYTSGTYGFTVFYPEASTLEYGFATDYHLGAAWRANALPEVAGTPIVAIIPYSVSNEDTYPRRFSALVRVGASSDPLELSRCLTAGKTDGETRLPDVTINGQTWAAFSFMDAGMMQYVRGVSYRTVHEGSCIALEQIATGASYREEPSSEDIPDEVLDAKYANLASIVESFVFVR